MDEPDQPPPDMKRMAAAAELAFAMREKFKVATDGAKAPVGPEEALERYRSTVRRLPRPTSQQMIAFAHYVASAHSWYKKIPWWPPGVRFGFYLSPAAGMDVRYSRVGTATLEPRLEQGFHHAAIPTARYRERFGYLKFSQGDATRALVQHGAVVREELNHDDASYYDTQTGAFLPLPISVEQAGETRLSAILHVEALKLEALLMALPCVNVETTSDISGAESVTAGYTLHSVDRVATLIQARELVQRKRLPPWPRASGGEEALLQIIDRALQLASDRSCLEPMEPGIDIPFGADRVLFNLLNVERERQLALAGSACRRVCDLVYGAE